jgi:hypothetical protein
MTSVGRHENTKATKSPDHQFTRSPIAPAAIIVAVLASVAAAELWMGRVPMCTCGTIRLWTGAVNSAENSQQITDWYTFTHIAHGLIFYAALWLVARRVPMPLRLLLAVLVEGTWEIVENSPFIIDRYRAATISLDYYGDSVINSLSDIVAMMIGFWIARRLRPWVSVALLAAMEVMLAVTIRDNLTLNIIMLIHPIEAIKHWQVGL